MRVVPWNRLHGFREDPALTAQGLALKWSALHLQHERGCSRGGFAMVSVSRFAEHVAGCTCSVLLFRPVCP